MIYNRTVRFADTDAAGVVYFAHILNFCHEAYEDALLKLEIRIPHIPDFPHLALPISHAELSCYAPLTCGDSLEISLRPVLLSPTSFEITYAIRITATENLAAQAKTRHVCINGQTRQRCELPLILQAWVNSYVEDRLNSEQAQG